MSNILEEPYDGRLSRTVLWEAWGEIPLVYSITNTLNEPLHKQNNFQFKK